MPDLGGAQQFLRPPFWLINTISRSTQ